MNLPPTAFAATEIGAPPPPPTADKRWCMDWRSWVLFPPAFPLFCWSVGSHAESTSRSAGRTGGGAVREEPSTTHCTTSADKRWCMDWRLWVLFPPAFPLFCWSVGSHAESTSRSAGRMGGGAVREELSTTHYTISADTSMKPHKTAPMRALPPRPAFSHPLAGFGSVADKTWGRNEH